MPMHISQLHKVVELGEFSLSFISAKGEQIDIDRCICTSFHSSGLTMNIKLCTSEQVRTVNRYTIIKINDKEMYL